MLKPIAVSGMTLAISPETVTGDVAVVSLPSTRVNAGGSGVYRGPVSITVSNVTENSFVIPNPVLGNIQPTAVKGRAEGQFLLREGDTAIGMSGTGQHSSGSGATQPINFIVEVTEAGQSKDRSE